VRKKATAFILKAVSPPNAPDYEGYAMKLVSISAALLSIVSFSASANETLQLDTNSSTVGWKGTKKLGSAHNGGVKVKSGSVTFDKTGLLSGGDFVIDMKSISNEDLKDSPDYQKKLVGHLSSADFFAVEKFPTASFKITQVKPNKKSKSEMTITGNFTMIGKTQPVSFPAKVSYANGKANGEAVIKIDRTKFGLKYGSGNFFKELTADKIISDEFELTLKLAAKK
jgi:polyisoprenoid-binding protein YceI